MSSFTVEDIERCLIAEFSMGGDPFGGHPSRAHRRERIRIAILREKKEGRAFHDSGTTYAEAFRRCFGSNVELRRSERDPVVRVNEVIESLEDDEDEGG